MFMLHFYSKISETGIETGKSTVYIGNKFYDFILILYIKETLVSYK